MAVSITGSCNILGIYNDKLISIEDWGYTGTTGYSFGGSTNLSNIASPRVNTFKKVVSVGFCEAFYDCKSLSSIPEDLFANCPNVTSFASTFAGCSSLSSIPEDLFASCPNVTSFASTFELCTSLSSIPEDLFADCPNVTSFVSTFVGCNGLTGETIIPIWENYPETLTEENGYVGIPDGRGCYYNCNFTLEEESQIPEYWRQSGR